MVSLRQTLRTVLPEVVSASSSIYPDGVVNPAEGAVRMRSPVGDNT